MKNFLLGVLIVLIFIMNLGILYIYAVYGDSKEDFLKDYKREHTILNENIYTKTPDNTFVELIDDFDPKNKQDLLNIYFTIFSSGMKEFTFYCNKEYENCVNDVKTITSDEMKLSHINNFIHTFNSYKSVKTKYNENGRITIEVNKVYDDEKIKIINDEIDKLFPKLVFENKTKIENIRNVHDYIINNTKYDISYLDNTSTFSSNTAYGPLFEGHAICSGYTDLMGLFLDRMDVKNYKISNEKHVWNYVYVNGEWLHLDLTWNDPIAKDGSNKNILKHDYFLITTDELHKLDVSEHEFDKSIYAF